MSKNRSTSASSCGVTSAVRSLASRPRQGLGGDHPRGEILSRPLEGSNRTIEVGRGKLIEPRRLKPRAGQHEDGAGLAAAGGGVDHLGPARLMTKPQAIAAVERIGGVGGNAA